MTINIEIINEQEIKHISEEDQQMMEQVIKETAKMEELESFEVVISLVDNEAIHQLNRDYRGIDRPTDVLSFAMNDESDEDFEIFYDEEDEEEVPNMLGDIIISIEKTIEQATEYGHSFTRELGFLTVHGFLHLLGYDHETEEEEKMMFSKQEEILERLNIVR